MPHRSRLAALTLSCLACGCAATGPIDETPAPPTAETHSLLLADFEADHPRTDTHSGEWRAVNDNIMGGRSAGDGRIRDGAMVFSGSTNTNGGGFSSVRATDTQWDLSDYEGLAARVRADVRGIGLMIDDGLDGPFTLKADWIKAVTTPDQPSSN